jgi:hypothetical protein
MQKARLYGIAGCLSRGALQNLLASLVTKLNARGWTALHFREGDSKHCRKAHVVDNDIVRAPVLRSTRCSLIGSMRRRMGRRL